MNSSISLVVENLSGQFIDRAYLLYTKKSVICIGAHSSIYIMIDSVPSSLEQPYPNLVTNLVH